jgi:predicted N-acetyltransferase YhbS
MPDRSANHGQSRSLAVKGSHGLPGLIQVTARAVSAFQAGATTRSGITGRAGSRAACDSYDEGVKGTVGIRRFIAEDASAICALCQAEGWDYWDDTERVGRALGAPGVTTLVAERGGQLVGAIEVISDGAINWVIGAMIVSPEVRNEGIGTRLLEAAFEASGAKRLDLQTEDDGPRFYRRFEGREMVAFRLYSSRPAIPGDGTPPTSRGEGPPEQQFEQQRRHTISDGITSDRPQRRS